MGMYDGWIQVRGAHVHNLKNVDIDIPLGKIVGIAGVSGSGKSSLALGVLYAEGSRRYLEALSTYTRRRMTQASRANVDEIRYAPAALALHQRPSVPGIRSTFGTSTELLNSLRLMFSRLASHRCPNGHYVAPSIAEAAERPLVCPECGVEFQAPSAEELAFNSQGACRRCGGTGVALAVDRSTLVPNQNLTIDQGAVAPWKSLMWSLMTDVCRAMGVRTDVPFCDLTDQEKQIVYDGPAIKKHILYQAKNSETAAEMDFTYYSAVHTVENALAKVKDDKGVKRVAKFLKQDTCPECRGTRLSERARSPKINGLSLDQVCQMELNEALGWVSGIPDTMPDEMRQMAINIVESFQTVAKILIDLGLGYLTLDRASNTLSTGELQRVQLARTVRNRTTGVLYVLDEPSIGLHPANVDGLIKAIHQLADDGNTVLLVDHDTRILKAADYLVEMGPGAGKQGGQVVASGSPTEIEQNANSLIGPFMSNERQVTVGGSNRADDLFAHGEIALSTDVMHGVRPMEIRLPKGRLSVVTGVSGSGKTTLLLEGLYLAVKAVIEANKLPQAVKNVQADDIRRINLIDSVPIGSNVRSTVATYCGLMTELRRAYAATPLAKQAGYDIADFSYNTGRLRCANCDGAGTISLDVQFLPDVEIACPDCQGGRYSADVDQFRLHGLSIAEVMRLTISEALSILTDLPKVHDKLQTLANLGLGYLAVGEATPSLSGGEAQRLKLATEIGKSQHDAIFLFDEPSIGLHPLDIEVLLKVLRGLIANGATVVVIEHDLDMIKNADYAIDVGIDDNGRAGQIIYQRAVSGLKDCPDSITGRYL